MRVISQFVIVFLSLLIPAILSAQKGLLKVEFTGPVSSGSISPTAPRNAEFLETAFFPGMANSIGYDHRPNDCSISNWPKILPSQFPPIRKMLFDSRTIVTRPRHSTAPTWDGKKIAFIVPPEIWYFHWDDSTRNSDVYPQVQFVAEEEPTGPPGTFVSGSIYDFEPSLKATGPSLGRLFDFMTGSEVRESEGTAFRGFRDFIGDISTYR